MYIRSHSPFFSSVIRVSLLLLALSAQAEVWVYPAPTEEFRSPEYAVSIRQNNQSHRSFVYADKHQDPHLQDRMSDFNHWTTFSFSGTVIVEVTRLKIRIANAEIRPLSRKITTIVNDNTATFTLDRPGQFWVKIPGTEEHPLFIFADAPETDIPQRTDPNVIWFEAGKVTDIGERYLIKSGQTVYIPGGAYVKGTITAESASDITIRGRGILSGLGYARRPSVTGIPYNTIMFNGTGNHQIVEGITITDPQHFCILSRGQITARNVKLFGWWHQTDGWGGGDGSIVEDSFMKVNDDNVKFYGTNQIARRLVLYQQINGAPFQLGWGGASQQATNCLAEDIDVIACEAATKIERESNQAFLNLRHQSPESVIDGVTLRRIRVDSDLPMLVGLTQVKGTVRNLHFEDVQIKGRINGKNFLRTEGTGSIQGLRLENVSAGGKPPTEKLTWSTTGKVEPVAQP